MNNFKVGILQGRLSPSLNGRFQFFPEEWQKEFKTAKEIGFDSIEWLFDWVDFENNPIFNDKGRMEIEKNIRESGVKASSICADYYMEYVFTGNQAQKSIEVLKELVKAANITSEKLILIPLLEKNAPKSDEEKKEIILNIKKALPEAEKNGVRIAFETEMPKEELLEFLKSFNSESVGAYYDIGNATSYRFNCVEDIRSIKDRIFGIHAKDRKKGSAQSVILGEGDSDYPGCVEALKEVSFSGVIIMQAWRGQEYLEDAKNQLLFLKQYI